MRGQNKLKALAETAAPVQAKPQSQAKLSLHDEKIALLTARYVYYLGNGGNGKMKIEDILAQLSKEFFVSTNYIADLLISHSDLINNLRRQAPNKQWFQSQWEHLVW